ncbi:MAG: 4Fe-4S ferredoxin [Anaerolineales bacterium]|nr:4Fe-4S ferredoxin [Anaerolineales bacterium]
METKDKPANQVLDIEKPAAKDGWICPSTQAFWEESRRTRDHSVFDFLHGYFYSRWPYLYIGIANGEHPLSPWFTRLVKLVSVFLTSKPETDDGMRGVADKYHAKVLTSEGAKQLLTVREDIRVENLEQVIPYNHARDIILKNSDHIVSIECPCRSSRANPCTPLDVCLIVGEPFARFIVEHHPQRARWIDVEEACYILETEHARGHVHHAFFNVMMLNRFFGICNCCSCCCTAMQAMRNGTPMLASSGYVSVVATKLCIGCGDCEARCPFGAMKLVDGIAEVDDQVCMGCGICTSTCEVGAPSLVRDPTKCEPLEIQSLLHQVETR